MGKAYTDDAYKELIYTHKDWQRTADEYEQQFAANLYKTNYVQEAARTALLKLSGMLKAYYGVRQFRDKLQADEFSALTDIAEQISGQKLQKNEEQAKDRAREGNQVLEEALLPAGDSSTGAGQIGNVRFRLLQNDVDNRVNLMDVEAASEENYENIDAVINRDGNLREQMTMLYNGMFINGGHSKEQIASSRSLKNMLLNITPEDLALMQRAGKKAGNQDVSQARVRFDLLEEMEQYKKEKDLFDTFSIARDLKKGKDKVKGRGYAVTRWFGGMKRGMSAAFGNFFKRSGKKAEDRKGLGLEYYERLNIGLSERERANAVDENGNLKWLEGQAYYDMKDKVTAEGMLQTAGTSGTTLRMMGAYKLLGASKQDLLYFRLALIAWMVTSKDHSIYEVLKGSHNAGVRGYEDLSEAAKMYKTIDPIPEKEIRDNLAPNHRYPHETIYLQMLNEVRALRRGYMKEASSLYLHPSKGSLFMPDSISNANKSEEQSYEALNYDAGDVALNMYTTSMYKVMNISQRYGSLIGHMGMKWQGIDMFDSSELKNKGVEDAIYNIARLSSRISMDALEENSAQESPNQEVKEFSQSKLVKPSVPDVDFLMDEEMDEVMNGYLQEERNRQEYINNYTNRKQAYKGITFRGGKVEKGFEQEGAVIRFSNLTSTTMNPASTENFYLFSSAPRNKRTIIRFKMTGKGAVNIMDVSKFGHEQEVLVSPGSQFRVTKPLQRAYMSKDRTKVRFQEDMTEGELRAFHTQEQPDLLDDEEREYGKNDWLSIQMVELEEISGAGEDRRNRMNVRRQKSDEARRRLLERRNAAAAAT